MPQETISKVQKWLPELNPCDIDFQVPADEKENLKIVNQASDYVRNWAEKTLSRANIPTANHEANSLIQRFDPTSDEGCALRVIIELDALNSSLRYADSHTSALAGMKLFQTIWRRKLKKLNDENNKQKEEIKNNNAKLQEELLAKKSSHGSDEDIKLYQKTINDLKRKYPHCNVNALRLLASTRLNVTKQDLDDLDISPE